MKTPINPSWMVKKESNPNNWSIDNGRDSYPVKINGLELPKQDSSAWSPQVTYWSAEYGVIYNPSIAKDFHEEEMKDLDKREEYYAN